MNSCKPVTLYTVIITILLISLSSSFATYVYKQRQKQNSDLIDAINTASSASALIILTISFIVSLPILVGICNYSENSKIIVTSVILIPLLLSSICCSSMYLSI